tara:strand:+ start:272 stop:1066 length:795 start_codon:yes stop_codon:yes gene_type:complete
MKFNCINWVSVEKQIKEYGKNPPFDYVVIDNFFENNFAKKIAEEFPAFNSDIWHSYNNAIEVKKTCNNWNVFPKDTYSVFSYFNSQEWLKYLSTQLLGGKKLYSDSGLNGGGWHAHKKGGLLNTHLDYSLHPKLQLQRKLNIIVYLSPDWKKEWGGSLGLWGNESSEKPGDLVVSLWNKFNRAVIFDTTQNSWHGLPEPVASPNNEIRQSLAAYFLCEPPNDVDTRGKAQYAPTAEQEGNSDIIELIRKRSSVETAHTVHRNDS